ncbi:MAG: phosphate acetyltransferase [Caldilineales bacterium]|nr:phosphate acetyltransferase [Caldilineales bacterium]
MTNSIFIATTEPYSGKSLVSLGIMEMLLRRAPRVGIFRPVIKTPPPGERDKNIELLRQHFQLDLDYESTYAFRRRDAVHLISQGRMDELLDRIIEKYKTLEAQCDFVVCIGSDFEGEGAAFEFGYNADIARSLGTPVLIVASGMDQEVDGVVDEVQTGIDAFCERGCQVLGAIVNRANPFELVKIKETLRQRLGERDLFLEVIPATDLLSSPTVREIAEFTGAEVLYGGNQLDRLAHRNLVIAMQVQNFLPRLREDALLIFPGDRSDVLLAALQAHQSRNFPRIAGILLTGGLRPPNIVARLLEGLPGLVPVLLTQEDTYTTATKVGMVRSYITSDNRAKIRLSLDLFEEYVDGAALTNRIVTVPVQGVSPKMFIYNLTRQAQMHKRHIVLPEGEDDRILRAAEALCARDIVDLTILGDPDAIRASIRRLGLTIDLDQIHLIAPRQSPHFLDYAETLVELRKHKGMNLDMAVDQMTDVSYFGTMMVHKGHAHGMVSGAAHTTQHTLRPALQFVKTKPGFSVVSSVFFMLLADRVLVYGDCAVNPNPNAAELAEIAIASADTAQAFGIQPRVAMLSYSSGESGVGADVDRVREATQIARQRRPDLKIEGPIQYDAAVDPDTAAKKMPGSEVAGQATVFIFPDLNTGNNTYKAVQRETGAIAIGPVLQGLRKPVNDLSRGCTVEDIINTVIITAIQSQED